VNRSLFLGSILVSLFGRKPVKIKVPEFLDISGLGNDKSVTNSRKTRAKKGRKTAILEFPFSVSIFARFFPRSERQKARVLRAF